MTYAMRFEVSVYVDEEPTEEHMRETIAVMRSTLAGRAHDIHGEPVDLGCPSIVPLGRIEDLDE